MKLGMDFPQKWKEKSQQDKLPLSDVLYGYAIEDLMVRIGNSSFQDFLWLTNEQAIGEAAYRKKTKDSLEFLYYGQSKKVFSSILSAGAPFSKELIEILVKELFLEDDCLQDENAIYWNCVLSETEPGICLQLEGIYMQMHVPVTIRIDDAQPGVHRPIKKEMKLMFEKKTCSYLSYSKESILSESAFEIMRKLELISNMEAYDTINEILKNQTVSGRHIIEDLKILGAKEPKVISKKRLEQVISYKDYGYMKKKWQQYSRVHNPNSESWEVVMERVLAFLIPLWNALCENEIFFGDWMPELGRFLY